MSLVTFGATFRGSFAGIVFHNTTASNVLVPLLGLNIPGNSSETVSLTTFDDYARNMRHPQVYSSINTGTIFKDDFTDLAKQIQTGVLGVSGATYNATTNTFTTGASAAYTVYAGDGSVAFT